MASWYVREGFDHCSVDFAILLGNSGNIADFCPRVIILNLFKVFFFEFLP